MRSEEDELEEEEILLASRIQQMKEKLSRGRSKQDRVHSTLEINKFKLKTLEKDTTEALNHLQIVKDSIFNSRARIRNDLQQTQVIFLSFL